MRNKFIFAYYYILSKMRKNKTSHEKIRSYLSGKELIPGKVVKTSEEINRELAMKIESGQPFMAGRFGATELSAISTFDFENKRKYEINLQYLKKWSGFFPQTEEAGIQFTNLMISLIPEIDVIGVS